MKALLPTWFPWARRRLALSPATEAKVRAISARQMDRVLAPDKRTIRRRLYGRTTPGTLLKHHIPVKTDHWDVRFFFAPLFDGFSGVAAFFRLLKKSPRLGTGISAPLVVLCVFGMDGRLSLANAYLRLNRGHEHFKELQVICADICKGYARAIAEKMNPGPLNLQENVWVEIHPSMPEPPTIPPKVGILIGETAYNLRAALDYLIGRLSKLDSPDLIGERKTQFPVEHSPERFETRRLTWLAGLNDTHVDLIENYQPYKGCQWSSSLAVISNVDKHSDLVIVKSGLQFAAVSSSKTEGVTGQPQVQMHLKPTLFIALRNGLPVIPTLHQLGTQITKMLDAFKPEFKG